MIVAVCAIAKGPEKASPEHESSEDQGPQKIKHPPVFRPLFLRPRP